MKKLSLLALVAVMADSAVFAEQVEHLFVESYDGAHFKCELRLPVGDGPHPALMYIHGGRGGQPPGPNYARYVRSYMLADGYAYFDIDYRRYSIGTGDLEDVVACYRYLQSRPEIDPNRVGIIADSYGGYLALLLASKERPAAVVACAGLVDLIGLWYDPARKLAPRIYRNWDWFEKLLHGGMTIREESDLLATGQSVETEDQRLADECPQGLAFQWGEELAHYEKIAPLEQYEHIESPLLYIVGSEDGFKDAGKELVVKLQAIGRVAEYSEHPGVGHSFAFGLERDEQGDIHEEFYRALQLMTGFFRRWVKSPAP